MLEAKTCGLCIGIYLHDMYLPAVCFNKQPNDIQGQDCLQIYNQYNATNGWNDEDCNNLNTFICSWKICRGIEIGS